jgi:hypothetical protein
MLLLPYGPIVASLPSIYVPVCTAMIASFSAAWHSRLVR